MFRKFPIAHLRISIVVIAITLLAAGVAIVPRSLPLPGGESGIGFDDMGFAPSIHKVLVPAGRSGNLDLIDPDTCKSLQSADSRAANRSAADTAKG